MVRWSALARGPVIEIDPLVDDARSEGSASPSHEVTTLEAAEREAIRRALDATALAHQRTKLRSGSARGQSEHAPLAPRAPWNSQTARLSRSISQIREMPRAKTGIAGPCLTFIWQRPIRAASR